MQDNFEMFDSHQKGAVGFTFTNGTRVSIVWKPGSYSDNHDVFDNSGKFASTEKIMGLDGESCYSTTAELMVTNDPTGRAIPYVERKYGQNPAGYLTVDEVMATLNHIRRIK